MCLRGNEGCLFRHLCYAYLWNVCLLLKPKGSGKAVSGNRNPYVHCIPASKTSCKQSSASCVSTRAQLLPVKTVVTCVTLPGLPPHPRRKKSILHWLTLTAHCCTICYVLSQALLPAKTIKANRAEMFKCLMQNFVNSTVICNDCECNWYNDHAEI